MRKEYDFSKGKRAAVAPSDPHKIRITIRLDAVIINRFKAEVRKAGEGNYQTLINEALREYLARQKEPLEKVLRRVIREELHTRAA